MPEYGSSGIWVNEPVGPFRHGMIEHSKLGLDTELSKGFDDWIAVYWRILSAPDTFDVTEFNDKGRRLAMSLKRQLGDNTEILFVPLHDDGSLGKDEVIAS